MNSPSHIASGQTVSTYPGYFTRVLAFTLTIAFTGMATNLAKGIDVTRHDRLAICFEKPDNSASRNPLCSQAARRLGRLI